MLKIIGFIFILFSGISLIVTASLFEGIEIDNISYKNINIKKLYLKYDKKLNISTPEISILDKTTNKTIKIRTLFTIDYNNNLFEIDVKKFLLDETDLFFNGLIIVDQNKIDLNKKSQVTILDATLRFDKQLKDIKTKKVFIIYENNTFDLTFEKPYYGDVDISRSKVSYSLDTNILKLYLKTHSLINDTLKNALLRYDVKIPLKQYNGKNDIAANIFIPFSKGKLFIESDVKIENTLLETYGQKLEISQLLLNYKNKIVQGTFYLKNYNYDDINITDSLIKYNASFKNGLLADINSSKLKVSKNGQIVFFNDVLLNLENNIVNTNLTVEDSQKNYNVQLTNNTNLKEKKSSGNIVLNTVKYKKLIDLKNKNIPYNFSYENGLMFYVPMFELTYLKPIDTNTHKLIIKKPNKILDAFTFIKQKKQTINGSIEIVSEDLNDTTININNFNFDINSTYFDSAEDNTTQNLVLPLFPKITLSYKDSTIGYDQYNLKFDTLTLNTNRNKLNLLIKKDNSVINVTTENNSIIFNANNISAKYFNYFLNKEIFEEGTLDLNVYGDDINLLSGDLNFHKTTIRNVRIVNSLTTFVNTTPAIINPLLALPTLFRMAETGFDTNGYYMKNGNGSFIYSLPTKQLDIFDLYTNGKMSNFIVNSHLDLKTKKVIANVDISFLKDFTKAIRHIPLVGYIFLGDDGEFHTSVDISGTIDNPILETHTVKEGTKGVTGIIKRILTLPLQPFKIKNTKEESKQHDKRVEEFFNQ
jgi:hypothetical protein